MDAAKNDLLADLFSLTGDGQTAEDFETATIAAFEAADVEDVDIGVVRPVVPELCNELDSDITDVFASFTEWADTFQTCENRAEWLSQQLATACE